MTRVRDEHGEFTLVGLLVAMALFLGVLAATLSLFATSEVDNRDIQRRNDAMDRARSGVDQLTRQLRNMATPTKALPQAVSRAQARDVIFQTVNPVGPAAAANSMNISRVRYCVDDAGRLYKQTQTWTTANAPGVPAGTACPAGTGTGSWDAGKDQVLTDQISNYLAGRSRPVFSYQPVTTDLTQIRSVHIDLYLDLDVAHSPNETLLSSGVFLRNQNRQPTAVFTPTGSAAGIVLNGSASSDPEGEPLTYCWYDLSAPQWTPAASDVCAAGPLIGTGVTFTDAARSGETRTVWLEVADPAGLTSTTGQQEVRN